MAPIFRLRCWLGQHPTHCIFTFHIVTTSRVATCRCGKRVECLP